MMKRLLDTISVVGSYMVIFGVVFLVQDVTLGKISFLHDTILFGIFRLKDILFVATSILFIFNFVEVNKPRRDSSNSVLNRS